MGELSHLNVELFSTECIFIAIAVYARNTWGKKKVSAEKVTRPHNSSSLPSQALDLQSAVLQSTVKNLILFQALIVLVKYQIFLESKMLLFLVTV